MPENDPAPLDATVSLSFKANLGNYQSAEVFVSLAGITRETTEEQVMEMLDGPIQLAYMSVKARVFEAVASLKNDAKQKTLP